MAGELRTYSVGLYSVDGVETAVQEVRAIYLTPEELEAARTAGIEQDAVYVEQGGLARLPGRTLAAFKQELHALAVAGAEARRLRKTLC